MDTRKKNRSKFSIKNKVKTSVLSGLILSFFAVTQITSANTSTKNTEEINNEFEIEEFNNQKTTIRPKGEKIGISELLDWNPREDAENDIYKGKIPLADREKGHKINPLANDEAKIQSLAYMSSSSSAFSAVGGSETMDIYAFDYWQYLDSLVYWDGVIPTPDVIDGAHRNGVPVYGTLFFDWSTSWDSQEIVNNFLKKDDNGKYPTAEKLVEIAKYYGFDGYFINQETNMPSGQGYSEEFRDYLLYVKEYAEELDYPINMSWYDAMDNNGSRAHHNAVNSSNDLFVKPDKNGTIPANEFFMNFNWSSSQVDTTVKHMKDIGRSQYDAYAGLELQANGYYNTNQKRSALLDSNKQTKLSLSLFVPDTVLGIADGGEDYHLEADKFWTGFDGNPATEDDSNSWSGMSRFVTDKTPITKSDFHTDFNSGHGRNWFVKGELSNDKAWNSRGIQDVMPTWRWWIEDTNTSVDGRYDYDDAYNGGTSLAFEGEMESGGESDVMLYSTEIEANELSRLKVVTKENISTKLQIGLSTSSKYSEDSFVYYDLDSSKDWKTNEFDLKDLTGETIYAIKLRLQSDSDISDYKLNLGQLAITSNENSIETPKNVEVMEKILFNAQSAEATIKVDSVENAEKYEVYQRNNGKWEYVNASSSNILYLPNISRSEKAKGTEQDLKVVAVANDGTRSEEKIFRFDWGMEVADTTLPSPQPENMMLEAEITTDIEAGNTESPENILNGTINGTADKWFSSKSQDHVDIKFDEPRTVRRWVVEHAGAGGESVNDGLMNTKDFNLEYKNNETGEWEVAKEIRDNIAHVTDVILDESITATEWRLNILTADNGTPWGGIRIYNWKMYESYNTESENLPMATAKTINSVDNQYSIALTNGVENSKVNIYSDRNAKNKIGEGVVDITGNVVFHNIEMNDSSGLIYYRTQSNDLEWSNILAVPYEKLDRNITKVDLVDSDVIDVNENQPLDLSNLKLTIKYSDETKETVRLSNVLVDVENYDENQYGEQKLAVSYAGFESETPLVINYEPIDFDEKTVSNLEIKTLPKQKYQQGEKLDLTNGIVTIHYEDDTHYDVPLSNPDFFEVSGFDIDEIGEQTIVITHRDHEVTYKVTVDKKAINFQRLEQLIGDFEALKEEDKYDYLAEEDKEKVDEFISYAHDKIEEEDITQKEIDQIVDENHELLEDIRHKLSELDKLSESISEMKEKVEKLIDEGEFADTKSSRLVMTHLTAVERYEEQGDNKKVAKHLEGFKKLITNQSENEIISKGIFEELYADADYLIKHHVELSE